MKTNRFFAGVLPAVCAVFLAASCSSTQSADAPSPGGKLSLRLAGDYAANPHNRGLVYLDKDEAIADFTEVIRLNSGYTGAYYNRGNAYAHKDDVDRAIADYTEAIRLNLDYANAYNNRGNAYYEKGDYDRAIAEFEAALRIAPDFIQARENLSTVRGLRGY